MRRLQLSTQDIRGLARRHKQIAVDPFKVTVDRFRGDDGFSAVYGCGMALSCKPRTFLPMHTLDLVVAVVERTGQMRSCSRSFPARDRPIVEDDD